MTHPVISFKPSYNSVIRGCPGLPDTLPRIECELRIRSSDGKPFRIDKIEVCLKTVETLNSGLSFGSKSKFEKIQTHYRKNIMISEKLILGIDIPLTIALPDDVKETNFNPRFGKTITLFECNVHYTLPSSSNFSDGTNIRSFMQPVNVERYTYLATKRLYPPITKQAYSADKKFIVNYTIHNPCITSDDLLHVTIDIKPNLSGTISTNQRGLFSKKVKLKNLSYDIKEILEVQDSHMIDSREHILHSTIQNVGQVLDNTGIKLKSDIRICTKNEYFRQFESCMQEPSFLYKLPERETKYYKGKERTGFLVEETKTKLISNKSDSLIPFQYHTAITTFGKLFSIDYVLYMRFKISNGKDFELKHRIDISPWPLVQIKYIEQIIDEERETARYAKQFYENFGGIKRNKISGDLEYPSLPPVIYFYDEENLKKLNIFFDRSHKTPRRIPIIE
ncbi:hypothetical protein TBLA_0A00570 [Henningerozyma blattae CBS 6284]|uniref:Arrestin-like N-terminal domain-containing protein n=1 Tax=Henningerozyma blattae (strain ATCC 34711 / CBS 6284 / DSM 70876 / NBRC 10599 / NRRL Y-10934 / UCD 77-7) TaxID=1071380 RepID=I2GUQ6_HENB6|nr:hypothetical protein TBLA_0A00570 [Tetrapisispora blattae CBS 6284]CCH57858.1 hypothetical protein TBLA_0A00570 [Tetrapisispora blattae CBS 6284]